jgi:hypothetical protein
MGIIPKSGEEKEHVGVIVLLFVHYVIGLGIAYLGQRTKNVLEFWAGIVTFIIVMGFLALYILTPGAPAAFENSPMGSAYIMFTFLTWVYVIVRLAWIYWKKETGLAII